jgi:hypothetical protein
MKKKAPGEKGGGGYVTSVRLDRDLAYQARELALSNERSKQPDDSLSKILNRALAEYLKKRA